MYFPTACRRKAVLTAIPVKTVNLAISITFAANAFDFPAAFMRTSRGC